MATTTSEARYQVRTYQTGQTWVVVDTHDRNGFGAATVWSGHFRSREAAQRRADEWNANPFPEPAKWLAQQQ